MPPKKPASATKKTRTAAKPAGRRKAADNRKPASKSAAGAKQRAAARKPPARRLSKSDAAARKALIVTALKMSRSGLSPGRSGNVSCRWREGMLITPTGMAYDELKPSDIVFVDGNGGYDPKARKPSSEWRFHLAAFAARPDMGAVVHTHSLHATVLACAHKSIPAFHYMIAVAGGTDIPVIPYAPFGTSELADNVGKGLAERSAVLMANHGQIALGKDLDAALELAQEVEVLAEQYYKVLTLGKPKLLGREAMADVLERFKSYGQNAQSK